jgi:hypothetical protein
MYQYRIQRPFNKWNLSTRRRPEIATRGYQTFTADLEQSTQRIRRSRHNGLGEVETADSEKSTQDAIWDAKCRESIEVNHETRGSIAKDNKS